MTCRFTWCQHLPKGVHQFFFIGSNNTVDPVYRKLDEPDTVVLPCKDDYKSLPVKTYECFKYALDNYNFEYLFKCDDDTYVVPDRLVTLDASKKVFVSSNRKGDISGGGGYMLCRDNVKLVVEGFEKNRPKHIWEDVMVQDIIRGRHGIQNALCEDMHMDCGGHWPDKYNSVITIHYAHAMEMEAVDAMLYSPTTIEMKLIHEQQFNNVGKLPKSYLYLANQGVRYIINGKPYHGIVTYDRSKKILTLQNEVDHNEIKMAYIGDGFWEEVNYGPMAIVSSVPEEFFLENCLPTEGERIIVAL